MRAAGIALPAPALAVAIASVALTASVAQAEALIPPVNTATPTISREGETGTPTPAIEASRLTAEPGEWEGTQPITYAYRWLSCTPELEGCTPIEGATSAAFTPTAAYLGRALEVEVTATNAAGSATASVHSSEVRALGGNVVAFGTNTHTELGAGYKDDYEDQPVAVTGLTGVTQVVSSYEDSYLLLNNGTVRSFGDNDFGQLGDGQQGQPGENWSKQESYVTVAGLTGVKSVASWNDHALALLENGTVETWGNNLYGQMGDGTDGYSVDRPKPVPGLSKVIAIAAGGSSDYALLSNHTIMAWGENTHGELGIGETGPNEDCHKSKDTCSTVPRAVGKRVKNGKGESETTPLTNVVAISGGVNAAYALLEDGHVMAWGVNNEGQMGTDVKEGLSENVEPEEVKTRSGQSLEGVTAISGGEHFALALLDNGTVDGWGRVGNGGELGEVEAPETCTKAHTCVKGAIQVKGLEHISAISAGEGYDLALGGGTVYGLGYNESGNLGNGNTVNEAKPVIAKGITSAAEISAGVGNGDSTATTVPHSLVLLQSGVQAPAPLLSLVPGEHSLKLSWNLTSPEYEVKYKAWSPQECEEKAEGEESGGSSEEGEEGEEGEQPPAEECVAPGKWLNTYKLTDVTGFELTGLVGEATYLVYVKSHNKDDNHKVRYVLGKPLG